MTSEQPVVLAFEGQGAPAIPTDHLRVIATLVDGVDVTDTPLEVAGMAPAVAQQAIVAHQVCQAAAFASKAGPLTGVIGQSLGELAALVVCGALAIEDALRVARLRAEVPDALLEHHRWTMLALTRVGAARAALAAAEVGGWLICHNGPNDTVVVVDGDRLDAFLECAEADPTRYRTLPVRHPYHTPMMAPVVEALAAVVADLDVGAPTIEIVSPIGPSQPCTPDDVRRTILVALTSPVQWSAALSLAAGRWASASWRECGPSNALRRFVWKNGLQLDWEAAA